ncbi:MAG: hypothetical protein NWF05_06400 [Candidatus Bathyarchaeota archaeon]|nr:hypothetical protein [Candidatus Bathyarchaeota archaeon]
MECGNTFKIADHPDDELATCPVCEATYKVRVENGKAKLEEFIYEDSDERLE